jgi:UDP-3-O-[3-hydroxymyristoyl] glucosamine N-acyltransferase
MSNLLILGAGQFGMMVKEIAASTGRYNKIDFLDDVSPIAIGKLENCVSFADAYEYAIVAIGNPTVRQMYHEKLKGNFKIATLVSPFAYVSDSASVGEGCIIEPMAVIQTGVTLGDGCIASSCAVVRHNATVECYCHLDCNSVVASGSTVKKGTKVQIGEIYRN